MTVASVVNSVRSAASSDLRDVCELHLNNAADEDVVSDCWYSEIPLDLDLVPCSFIKLIYSCE